jgi:glycosyltransferase involved in cell wall biosynthesis
VLKVAAYTGGRDVPAARFRVRQHIEGLRKLGIHITEYTAPLSSYPPKGRLIRPAWALASLAARVPAGLMGYQYDLTLFQREMLSTFTTLEGLTKRPRVLDVDDAIWIYRGGNFAARLARMCDGVICGNAFLAEQFGRWNAKVAIVPTAVDTDRFVPHAPVAEPIIGWSGTMGGLRYLYGIEKALSRVLDSVPDARLRIVSDAPPRFGQIPREKVEFIRWSPDTEVEAIQGMAVGIMPLSDSPWGRGKCSFKMLTYMSSGIPVVVSPVGMNREVLSLGTVGFGPSSDEEWVTALCSLLEQPKMREKLGLHGRRIVTERYSIKAVRPRLAQALRHFAR